MGDILYTLERRQLLPRKNLLTEIHKGGKVDETGEVTEKLICLNSHGPGLS